MPLTELAAICILDAGNNGIIFKADHVLGTSEYAHVTTGLQAHWAKVAFERFGRHTIITDEPARLGGSDEGPALHGRPTGGQSRRLAVERAYTHSACRMLDLLAKVSP